IRLAPRPEDIHAVRIAGGGANLLLGCDMVVAAGPEALSRVETGVTRAVINAAVQPTAAFVTNGDIDFGVDAMRKAIRDAAGGTVSFVDGTGLATALMGDSIATNLFMVGYAWQRGLIPLSLEAIHQAIELNGVAVEINKRTLAWGRLAAHDPAAVEAQARPLMREERPTEQTLDELIAHRAALLTDYQDAAYAARYRAFVAEVAAAEQAKAKGRSGLTAAVARSLAKLMAYKDEYEVARLYVSADFWNKIRSQFEGDVRLEINLAPPLLARRDPRTGELQKRPFGPWMFRAFRLLARLKRLRGTRWDVFGRTVERATERRLIEDYRELIRELLADLAPHNHAVAVELAALPDHIRGFGHVKERSIARARQRQTELLTRFRAPAEPRTAAG
ncbi:MAG: DUF6537 domain-containing protein, partial [Xanthobacteraceae bacterium]